MKEYVKSLVLTGLICQSASAVIDPYSFPVNNINATIPDADFNGYQNSQTLSGIPGSISHASVTLNISGGFNGDLYGYLAHGNMTAVLLNRVGRSSSSAAGYPDAGFGLDAS